MGEFQALGAVDRGQFHPVGVLSLGYGDEVRHREQIAQEGGGIDGVGTVEVTLRLIPERLDEDAREMGQQVAQGGGKGGKTVRPGRVADGPGKPRDGGRQRLVIAQGREGRGG